MSKPYEIYDYWSKLGITQEPLTNVCSSRIKGKIKELGFEVVKECIKNYNIMVNDSNCTCPRWGLINFITYHVQDFMYIKNAYKLWCKAQDYEYDEKGYLI